MDDQVRKLDMVGNVVTISRSQGRRMLGHGYRLGHHRSSSSATSCSGRADGKLLRRQNFFGSRSARLRSDCQQWGTARGSADMDVFRREALMLIAGAVVAAPAQDASNGGAVIMLSEETEAIVQRLISAGYHQTRDDVVNAALAAYQDAMEGNAIGFHGDQI
jgi:hypothetical protein